ncbi:MULTISPECIES: hypothetical protein [Actinokineospora]|uniref:Scaffolding protein n=1 Tax=Actinokineospora cianjurensis TaxID=585224 RepID=A0A421AYD3_9PSEU|nr:MULTISPECIES: hypothetical protein [Actinokineospora]MBM7771230.1 hypothetical protein [Actinokineospora baliensis]RLK54830.1 hypothetical protein CLV68_5219 [Actinokineospora cianjurensis]
MTITEPTNPAEPTEPAPTGDTDNGTTSAAGSLDELPEWAQNEIRRARTEAGRYRRERNAAQQALTARDTTTADPDQAAEVERLNTQLGAAQRDAARLRAAIATGVPADYVADFAARLVGDTDEELAADATRLRELLGLPDPDRKRPDPTQGAGLDSATTASTPAEAFAAFVQDRLN